MLRRPYYAETHDSKEKSSKYHLIGLEYCPLKSQIKRYVSYSQRGFVAKRLIKKKMFFFKKLQID